MTAPTVLSPFVYWGQTKTQITLNVALRDVENTNVELTDEEINFKAFGEGLQGFKQYQFSIKFFNDIDEEKSKYRVSAKNVEFQLLKKNKEVWPRLTYSNQKPQWLKVNFDQFAFEESSTDSEEERQRDAQLRKDFAEKEAKMIEIREWAKFRQFYLFVYNAFMFFGYTYIFIGLMFKYYQSGADSRAVAYETFGSQMMILQFMAVLEVVHPLFGVVKTDVLNPLLQVAGRGFVLFIVTAPNTEVHRKAAVWWLFLAWSLAEFCRYPFYIAKSYNKEYGLITYIRYTAWIVLYPMGICCEGFIMLESLHFYETDGVWSLELPNKYNMSFNFPAFLQLYMLAFLPASLLLINHMYVQRKKKISPNLWKREQLKKQKKAAASKGPTMFSQKVEKME